MKDSIDGLAFREGKRWDREKTSVEVYNTIALNQKAAMAVNMIDRWGMVAGMPDGENSDGSQRLRLATPEELIDRATLVTDLLFVEFRRKEWMLDLPIPSTSDESPAE